jgi:solute carrier family 25 S-adenosylmethionine transporter 26
MMGSIPLIQYLIYTVIVACILCGQKCQALSNINSGRLCDKNHRNHQIDDKDSNLKFHDPILSRGSFFAITAVSTATAVVGTPHITKALTSEGIGTLSETRTNEVTSFSTATNIATAASKRFSTRQSIAEFAAGAALGAVKTTVKYPLDSATVRLQMPNSEYSIKELGKLFSGSYDGITLSLLSNIPAGAIFFAAKDAVKTSLKSSAAFASSPKWVTTSIGVLVALLPYWVVRNPSEVIKVRQQAGIEGYGGEVNALEAIQRTVQSSTSADGNGISELYTGYFENYAYSCPADIIKFVGYEAMTQGRKNLSPIEGAAAGALATACTTIRS